MENIANINQTVKRQPLDFKHPKILLSEKKKKKKNIQFFS